MTPEQVDVARIRTKYLVEQAESLPTGRANKSWMFPAFLAETFSLICLRRMKNGYMPVMARLIVNRSIDEAMRKWVEVNLPMELINCDEQNPPTNMSQNVFEEILENLGRSRTLLMNSQRRQTTKARRSFLAAILTVVGFDMVFVVLTTNLILHGDYRHTILVMMVYAAMIVVSGMGCCYDWHFRSAND